MNQNKLIGAIMCFCIVALTACSGVSQQPAAAQKIEGIKVTVEGKIDYMKNFGGHYVMGVDPPGPFFIVNQDPKVLEELYKSGKVITIEGHYTIGADHLFIEKIDGQPYKGIAN